MTSAATTASVPAPPPSRVRAFRGGDQLQQLLRIVQPLLEFRSQRLSCDLGCDAHIAGQRIGRNELHFINLDRADRACSPPALP